MVYYPGSHCWLVESRLGFRFPDHCPRALSAKNAHLHHVLTPGIELGPLHSHHIMYRCSHFLGKSFKETCPSVWPAVGWTRTRLEPPQSVVLASFAFSVWGKQVLPLNSREKRSTDAEHWAGATMGSQAVLAPSLQLCWLLFPSDALRLYHQALGSFSLSPVSKPALPCSCKLSPLPLCPLDSTQVLHVA